jgi:hypothetical protein
MQLSALLAGNTKFEKPVEPPLPVLPSSHLAAGLAAETAAVLEQSKQFSEATAALSQANAERDHIRSQLQVPCVLMHTPLYSTLCRLDASLHSCRDTYTAHFANTPGHHAVRR